ncbi:hypothetical protein DAPPUDRAFT_239007 [Daphnia pulex]|uniref:Uncharacterized protein n=1 Tax=Daphnia pulex TaxID=6669 RepID=E9G7Z5_DAPPU|nr:hypothetical protein DAPPUDRAFT_239007 [Daphnia pulex]|eukprot:EFX84567.1 hypothetical protein DAPPUDRAFT_239007 [Daphnia pulex]
MEFDVESHSGAGDASDNNADVSGMRPLSVLGRLTHKLSEEEDLDLNVVSKNQPVLMSVYKNPDTKEENFVVVVKLHGCVSDVEFSLVDRVEMEQGFESRPLLRKMSFHFTPSFLVECSSQDAA